MGDNGDERSSTASVSPRPADDTRSRSGTAEPKSMSRSTDLAAGAHPPTTTALGRPTANTSAASDVREPVRRRNADDIRGRREEQQMRAVERQTVVPLRQSNTEASDPSWHRCRPVLVKPTEVVKPDDQGRPLSASDDDVVDVEDLNVADSGQTSVDDCLVTSLRAEVRPSLYIVVFVVYNRIFPR